MASNWLKLGVASLILAGLFSILLVLSRTPTIQDLIPFTDFFRVALVVHVDLSVLIWFLSFAAVLWSIAAKGEDNFLDKISIVLSIIGLLAIVTVPFLGVGVPLMNNYVPMLDHPAFAVGLITFTVGILLQIVRTLFKNPLNFSTPNLSEALRIGIYLGALVTLFAVISLVITQVAIGSKLEGIEYYEILFWDSGHILQYTHTVMLLVAWFWISNASGITIAVSPKVISWFFVITVLPLITVPLIYQQHDILTADHRLAFTHLMKYGGLASAPLGLIVVWSIFRSGRCHTDKKPVKAALLSSILLFAVGGIIGFMIDGANVVIPAHYHGSIVGVTLAFMGLAYHLLPYLGFSKPTSKMAVFQPYIYAGGQLLHIIGLAWSGGYGVQRKTVGAAQELDNLPEIAGMALMGIGGAISIVGGIMFIIVMIKSFRK